MSSPRDLFTLPAVHAFYTAEALSAWGISAPEFCAELGLNLEALCAPGARLPVSTFVELIEHARVKTGEVALGIHFGLRMRASAHGYLGFAAMTAATVGEALAITTRFAPTRSNAVDLTLHVHEGNASLVIEERADFGRSRDAILLALAIGISQIGDALTGRELSGTIDFAFPRPSYIDRFPALAPTLRFGQPLNQVLFEAGQLALPLTTADMGSLRLAYQECERSLEALCAEKQVLERVRHLVMRIPDGGCRSLDEIAREIHVSPRTLKRRLAASGATYSRVLDEQRRGRAALLLRSPKLSIDEVAAKLGYSDTANFGRAFRRWTGMSPGAYRRQSGEQSSP